MQFASVF
jgi:sulfur-carrier protein adenylyltransferase/sulfurtransferase